MSKTPVARLENLDDSTPTYAFAGNVDLVVVRKRMTWSSSTAAGHRGALLADGEVRGDNIVCEIHGFTFQPRVRAGLGNRATLEPFTSWIEDGQALVDKDEIRAWERANPQRYDRDAYLGLYADFAGSPAEPYVRAIQELARDGLETLGRHGRVAAMGPRDELPQRDDIQFVPAQLYRAPRLDEDPVETPVVIGPNAAKPLRLAIPLFVSDMSFGVLSEEAKVALARGAEHAGHLARPVSGVDETGRDQELRGSGPRRGCRQTLRRPLRSARTRLPFRTPRSKPSAASACARAIRTTAQW